MDVLHTSGLAQKMHPGHAAVNIRHAPTAGLNGRGCAAG